MHINIETAWGEFRRFTPCEELIFHSNTRILTQQPSLTQIIQLTHPQPPSYYMLSKPWNSCRLDSKDFPTKAVNMSFKVYTTSDVEEAVLQVFFTIITIIMVIYVNKV